MSKRQARMSGKLFWSVGKQVDSIGEFRETNSVLVAAIVSELRLCS